MLTFLSRSLDLYRLSVDKLGVDRAAVNGYIFNDLSGQFHIKFFDLFVMCDDIKQRLGLVSVIVCKAVVSGIFP